MNIKKVLVFKNFIFILTLMYLTLFFFSCATQRLYSPLKANESEFHFTLGGPLFQLNGIPVIMPLSYLGYKRYITKNFTAGIDLPLTLIALQNFSLDLNGIYFIKDKIGVQIESLFIWDIKGNEARLYPIINCWYVSKITSSLYIMPGITAMYQNSDPKILSSLFLNLTYNNRNWDYSIEIAYLAPYLKNDYTVNYISPGYGGIGIYLGISRKFK